MSMTRSATTVSMFLTLSTVCAAGAGDWPQWRGPDGTGAVADASPPVSFSPTENVRWKVSLPGEGHASPIIVGDRIFVATAINTGVVPDAPTTDAPDLTDAFGPVGTSASGQEGRRQEGRGRGGRGDRGGGRRGGPPTPTTIYDFVVLGLDRADGSTIWKTTLNAVVPHEGVHATGTMAGATPISDGRYVWASFGSRGIYCLDAADGDVIWGKDLGDMTIRGGFGEGASAALHGDTLVVPWDHEGPSFVVALDARTGDERWRRDRDEPSAWTTPVFVEADGRAQVILAGRNASIAYDLTSGDEVWRCTGMTSNVVPTPIVAHDMVYLISGFRGAALQAVKYDSAKGDVTDTPTIEWSLDRNTPYVPSPALSGTNLYFLRGNNAIVTCVDAMTGEAHYEGERLDAGNVYASPVAAAGRVYICDREGRVLVLRDGPEPEIITMNEMEEVIDATPAIVGKEMFLRTKGHLYCLAD